MIYIAPKSTHKSQPQSLYEAPMSWLSTEKQNQTQQKQTCTRNKIYCNIKLMQKN